MSDSQQQEEAPKKRARSAPPVPAEALRPKRARKHPDVETIQPFMPSEDAREAAEIYHARQKREEAKKKPPSSEGALRAEASGEFTAKEPKQEEEPYEEMTITEGPTASQQEAMNRENLRAETIELNDRFEAAKAEYEAVADAVDRRAKEIAADLSGRNFPAETILVWTEAIQKREGLQDKVDAALDRMIEARKAYVDRYEAWEKAQHKNESANAEMEKVLDEFVAKEQPASASFNAEEEAWFKKGEEEEAQQMEEARATIARGGQAESLIETPDEIEANVRQAQQMVASGELNGELFKVNDYRSLLVRKAQIDRDLETAGWWKARELRKEKRDQIDRDLTDYEQQIQSVFRERADERDKARGVPSVPARKVQAREGSGTTVHKKGFFSRLFGRE